MISLVPILAKDLGAALLHVGDAPIGEVLAELGIIGLTEEFLEARDAARGVLEGQQAALPAIVIAVLVDLEAGSHIAARKGTALLAIVVFAGLQFALDVDVGADEAKDLVAIAGADAGGHALDGDVAIMLQVRRPLRVFSLLDGEFGGVAQLHGLRGVEEVAHLIAPIGDHRRDQEDDDDHQDGAKHGAAISRLGQGLQFGVEGLVVIAADENILHGRSIGRLGRLLGGRVRGGRRWVVLVVVAHGPVARRQWSIRGAHRRQEAITAMPVGLFHIGAGRIAVHRWEVGKRAKNRGDVAPSVRQDGGIWPLLVIWWRMLYHLRVRRGIGC